ncbi:PDZ domain-containing protein [Luteolibacter sp. LG18]|uniref:PDZ domain-containing protein n=1 Tax=Luteolibacter sp. LG18 TaxID=2819286 RepID=UPI0030C683EA
MKRSALLLLALALPSCDSKQVAAIAAPEASAATAPAVPAAPVEPAPELKQSVVRINSTQQGWNAGQPWEKNPPGRRRALGPIVGKNQILTTSELIADSTYLEFETTDGTRLLPAKVLAVDYEANLALLGADDESKADEFFKGTRPLEIGAAPRIGDQLDILQVEESGMPLITPGNLQGVDVITNFLEGQFFLTFEVKASMQSAASSFSLPVLRHGELVGLLASYNAKDQVSDVTSTEILSRFLKSATSGHYAGFPSLGIATARTEDPSFRKWLQIPDDKGGLYVSSVRKGSSAAAAGIKKGDVLLSVGDHPIDRRGYYNHPIYGNLFWSHLVRGEKNTGDVVKVSLLREGKPLDLDVTLTLTDDTQRLVPAYTFGKAPRYLVKGGLVFQELTKPLLESFGEDWHSRAPLNLLDAFENPEKYEDKADHIVFLSGVIATPATIGYEPLRNLIVRKVNGKDIRDMKTLAAAFKSNLGGLHSIEFDEENFTVFLDEAASSAVDEQLMQRGLPRLSRVE